jgi:hypothetical protein
MPEQPKLVQLQDGDYYILPDTREYAALLPAEGERKARIRLRLLNATTLDIPMSEESLIALANDLRPYLPIGS